MALFLLQMKGSGLPLIVAKLWRIGEQSQQSFHDSKANLTITL